MRGIAASTIGRRAFRQDLKGYIASNNGDVGTRTKQALQICRTISAEHAAWDHTEERNHLAEQWVITRDPQYLDFVQGHFSTLTAGLKEWKHQYTFRYLDLLSIHIRVAIFCKDGETSAVRSSGTDYEADVDGYFGVLPNIIEEMTKIRMFDRHMMDDAWVTMMLRTFCLGACHFSAHFFVPAEKVPIEYYGSQLPVYIG